MLKAKLQGDRSGAADGIQTVQTTLRTTQDACVQAAADEEASGIGRRKELQVLSEAAKMCRVLLRACPFSSLANQAQRGEQLPARSKRRPRWLRSPQNQEMKGLQSEGMSL